MKSLYMLITVGILASCNVFDQENGTGNLSSSVTTVPMSTPTESSSSAIAVTPSSIQTNPSSVVQSSDNQVSVATSSVTASSSSSLATLSSSISTPLSSSTTLSIKPFMMGQWQNPIPVAIEDEDDVRKYTFSPDGTYIFSEVDYDWNDSLSIWMLDDNSFYNEYDSTNCTYQLLENNIIYLQRDYSVTPPLYQNSHATRSVLSYELSEDSTSAVFREGSVLDSIAENTWFTEEYTFVDSWVDTVVTYTLARESRTITIDLAALTLTSVSVYGDQSEDTKIFFLMEENGKLFMVKGTEKKAELIQRGSELFVVNSWFYILNKL